MDLFIEQVLSVPQSPVLQPIRCFIQNNYILSSKFAANSYFKYQLSKFRYQNNAKHSFKIIKAAWNKRYPFMTSSLFCHVEDSLCLMDSAFSGTLILNNLSKFGCSDGIAGGSYLAHLSALPNICFLKQLSLFPGLIRISPPSNRFFFVLKSKYPLKRFYGAELFTHHDCTPAASGLMMFFSSATQISIHWGYCSITCCLWKIERRAVYWK